MQSNDVKIKAIEVNSAIEVLMNSTSEVELSSRDEFSKKLIESSISVIKKYEEAELDEEFGVELRKELASDCISFF